MAYRRGEHHFTSLDFKEISVFSSAFPVDLSDSTTRKTVAKILPESLDGIFLAKGASATYETTRGKGALPLLPLSARIDLERDSTDDERKRVHEHTYILSSLTDDSPLTAAHVQLDVDAGTVGGFSVTSRNETRTDSPIYELRGYFANADRGESDEDSAFEVTKYTGDDQEWSYLVDEDMATQFVNALEERRTCRYSDGNLQSQLFNLVDASKDITKTEAGTYNLNNHDSFVLSIERTQRIRAGLARSTAWSLIMRETTTAAEGMNAARTFTLNYDRSETPRYTAQLDYLVRDEYLQTTHKDRESDYEQMSITFRDNPNIIFAALAQAAAKLQEISFDFDL